MTCLKKILATESFTQNLLNHADDLDYKCHQKIEVEKKIETNVNTIVESNKILRITTAFVDLKPKKKTIVYSEPYTCISKENIPTG